MVLEPNMYLMPATVEGKGETPAKPEITLDHRYFYVASSMDSIRMHRVIPTPHIP
jgi:hypothetical protein